MVYESPMAKPSPDLLRKVGLFSDLEEKDLASLANEFNERRFSAGDTIALEGAGGLMFFVVESGEASVEVHGEEVVESSVDWLQEHCQLSSGAAYAQVRTARKLAELPRTAETFA